MEEPIIFIVDAGNRRHFRADLVAMHRHRKAVFVDRAGWSVPVIADQEVDRYDLLPDTLYLLAKADATGPPLASTRLLTTTGPHLMRELYSPAFRAALPNGPTVWEASRYCPAPAIGGRGRRLALLWEIICGVMELALARGIGQVIFVANRALLPLALECGWSARVVGPTLPDGADEMTAVVAQISAEGLRTVRDRHGISGSVIQLRTDVGAGNAAPAPGGPRVPPDQSHSPIEGLEPARTL